MAALTADNCSKQPSEQEFNDIIKAALRKNFSHVESATEQQVESWKSLFLRSKDTFAVLPTGHGKSLRSD